MKITLSINEMAEMLHKDQYSDFSYSGAHALASYLDEEWDENTEFDLASIRGEFSEYDTLEHFALDCYGRDWRKKIGINEEAEADDEIKELIERRGLLIEFDGGIIVTF